MARRSASSSAARASTTNGHLPAPANAEGTPTTLLAQALRPEGDDDNNNNNDDEDTANSDTPSFDFDTPKYRHYEQSNTALPPDPSLLPTGSRSLSSIALQAFSLGFTLALCTLLSTHLALTAHPLWRLPAFFACLSLFHFLEFHTTARYNPPAARASSFLLFNNGTAYNIAHTLAATEIVISNFVPWYQRLLTRGAWTVVLGLGLVVVGQVMRSVAMAQAGTNFNHTPQKTRKEGHELVTGGVYGYLRHPSYFGFFWWALGTQVLVGNKVCLVGYAFALWKFFHDRIIAEEKTLVTFFGNDYEEYRERISTGIPFVR